jgi:tight adherence protein C
MDQVTIICICAAGAVCMVVLSLCRMLLGERDVRLHRRLGEIAQPGASGFGSRRPVAPLGIFGSFLRAVSKPFTPTKRETQSKLRRQLGHAGIYSSVAVNLIAGGKVMCLLAGLLVGYLIGQSIDNVMIGVSLGGLTGYLLPTFWLKQKIKSNRTQLNIGLPDALDLMVVCIEAGLTVDAAMQRVGSELGMAHAALSREFAIAHMETRVGLSRADALRNLGQRTGSPGLQSLATMLIQADRFGTSIAQALRIHAEALRTQRQQQAEEMAAKASVKMSFPLVLFIFPATFIVLAGPTVIGLMNSPMFK